jgi:tRNA-dihydrouridine synthase A
MAEPALVGDCVAAMRAAVAVPVTVKCRIGIDDQEPEIALRAMAGAVFAAGAAALVVHARKAWLKGLSPKENRDVPPLDYGLVHRLKAAHPDRIIAINGGIRILTEAQAQLAHVDGVMIGRAAYQDPSILIGVDHVIFGDAPAVTDGFEALQRFEPYVAARLAEGVRLHAMTRHLLGLFNARPGARAFRRHLATAGTQADAGLHTLREAAAQVSRETGVAPPTGLAA